MGYAAWESRGTVAEGRGALPAASAVRQAQVPGVGYPYRCCGFCWRRKNSPIPASRDGVVIPAWNLAAVEGYGDWRTSAHTPRCLPYARGGRPPQEEELPGEPASGPAVLHDYARDLWNAAYLTDALCAFMRWSLGFPLG